MSKRAHVWLAIAALIGTTQFSLAQSVGRPLTIEDYYRVLDVGAPQMSPDGRFVAFTVSRRIEATNGDSSEVWLSSATGGITLTRVSATGTHATTPQWDPNGRLRFTSGGRYWWYEPSGPAKLTDGGPAPGGGGRGVGATPPRPANLLVLGLDGKAPIPGVQ